MAIFKFRQIYLSIKEELGEEGVNKLFPEYSSLCDKMPQSEQAKLAKIITDRMDEMLDDDTVKRIRHKRCCNIPKNHEAEITRLKKEKKNTDEIIKEYSNFLKPGYIIKDKDSYIISFGLGKCVCGMFRKLSTYDLMSKTWCECCNAHVKKTFKLICDKDLESEIVEAVACGDKDCIFKIAVN